MTPVSYKRVSHFVTAYLEDVKLSLAADLVCVDSVYDVRRRAIIMVMTRRSEMSPLWRTRRLCRQKREAIR